MDKYLSEFIRYCQEKFKDQLVAIVIYGSYAWGYFDKRKSDYDVFVIFKNKTPRGKTEIRRRFKRIALQYFCTQEDLISKIRHGSWSVLVTLLKSAKVLHKTKGYEKFVHKLKKIDFLKELETVNYLEARFKKERNTLKRRKKYEAAKWAFHSIRKRLQLLALIKKSKLIWDFNMALEIGKGILSKEEVAFLEKLKKKVESRSKEFSEKDQNIAYSVLNRLDKKLLTNLKSIQNKSKV